MDKENLNKAIDYVYLKSGELDEISFNRLRSTIFLADREMVGRYGYSITQIEWKYFLGYLVSDEFNDDTDIEHFKFKKEGNKYREYFLHKIKDIVKPKLPTKVKEVLDQTIESIKDLNIMELNELVEKEFEF